MEPQSAQHLDKELFGWLDWLFRDRNGRVVIAQFPNTALWLAISFAAAGLVFSPTGTLDSLLSLGFSVSLLWWAIDEVVRGVNPFRRFLGFSAAMFVVVTNVTGLL